MTQADPAAPVEPLKILRCLVVFRPSPLKNDGLKVSWDDYSIPFSEWKVIKFHGSKPPTSNSTTWLIDVDSTVFSHSNG